LGRALIKEGNVGLRIDFAGGDPGPGGVGGPGGPGGAGGEGGHGSFSCSGGRAGPSGPAGDSGDTGQPGRPARAVAERIPRNLNVPSTPIAIDEWRVGHRPQRTTAK